MTLAFIIIGAILAIAGIGADIFFLTMTTRTHKKELNSIKQKQFFRYQIISSAVAGIGCLSLFLGGIYSNPKIETVHGAYLALMIIGTLAFIPAILIFINCMFTKHFKIDVEEKHKKKITYATVISGLSAVVFFLLMMEGYAPYITYPLFNSISFGGPNGFISLNTPADKTGGLTIAFYALCILSGAIFVYILCDHRLYKIYGKHGMLESTFLLAFPAGIVGARLWFCYVLEFDKYSQWDGSWGANVHNNPFQVWDGGLAIMGGALLGIIVGLLWVTFKKRELRIRDTLDIIVPTILIAQAIGRWGNFFNQEVYGTATFTFEELWMIPSFVRYNMAAIGKTSLMPWLGTEILTVKLPLFFVEFVTNLCGYFFIRYLFEKRLLFIGIAKAVKASKKDLTDEQYEKIAHAFPLGGCTGMYLIWYGFTRFFLEPLRQGEYEYNQSWVSSIILIGLGVGVIALFAIYQYLIEPKHPIYPNRLIPVVLKNKDEAVEGSLNDSINDENSENAAEPQQNNKETVKDEIKKVNKKSSINDDL